MRESGSMHSVLLSNIKFLSVCWLNASYFPAISQIEFVLKVVSFFSVSFVLILEITIPTMII